MIVKYSYKEFYDISLLLGEESFTYPGDPSFIMEEVSSLKKGGDCNISGISMSLHEGTHLDFPSHFLDGGKNCEDYSVGEFILPAVVIEIPDKKNHYKGRFERP